MLSSYDVYQNIIWLGTDNQGVSQINPDPEIFTTFTSSNIEKLPSRAVRAIYSDTPNRIFIGTKGGGMTSIEYLGANPLQKSTLYTINEGLNNNSVLSFCNYNNRYFWIGTDGIGLNYFCKKRNEILSLNIDIINDKSRQSVYGLTFTNDSTLWVGTSGNGLFNLNLGYKHNNDSFFIND